MKEDEDIIEEIDRILDFDNMVDEEIDSLRVSLGLEPYENRVKKDNKKN